MNRTRRKYCWALVGSWEGSLCAIVRGNYVPPFARWLRITRQEWRELRAEGFYTRRCNHRPTALLDKLDVEEQKYSPKDASEYQ